MCTALNLIQIEKLIATARRKTWEELAIEEGDDYCDIDAYAGGNIDDAYYGGQETGEILHARLILAWLNIEY